MRRVDCGTPDTSMSVKHGVSAERPWVAGPATSVPALVSRLVNLGAGATWLTAGNVVYAGCQILQLLVIARVLGASAAGLFALALSVTAPLVLFGNMQLRELYITDTTGRSFLTYRLARIFSSAVALVLIVIGGLLFGSTTTSVPIILVGLAKALDAYTDIHLGAFVREGDFRAAAICPALNGLISLIGTAGGAWFSGSLAVALGCYAAGSLVSLALAVVMTKPTACACAYPSCAEVSHLFREGWPLGSLGLIMSLNANVPRYVLAAVAGTTALGVFVLCASVIGSAGLVAGSVSQALLPRLRRRFEAGGRAGLQSALAKLLPYAAAAGLATVAATYLVLTPLTRLIGVENTSAVRLTFMILASATGLGYLLWLMNSTVLIARLQVRQFHAYSWIAAANVVAATVLIRVAGLPGAAVAVTLCVALQVTASWILVQSTTPVSVRGQS
jgi:O-antigen/teichoic acid export membrane protein